MTFMETAAARARTYTTAGRQSREIPHRPTPFAPGSLAEEVACNLYRQRRLSGLPRTGDEDDTGVGDGAFYSG
jgi:hypothetical protein|tara:strand:- start:1379 stop:1597 length:219 start_codon:yes stop_codon:yes gene_type:complete